MTGKTSTSFVSSIPETWVFAKIQSGFFVSFNSRTFMGTLPESPFFVKEQAISAIRKSQILTLKVQSEQLWLVFLAVYLPAALCIWSIIHFIIQSVALMPWKEGYELLWTLFFLKILTVVVGGTWSLARVMYSLLLTLIFKILFLGTYNSSGFCTLCSMFIVVHTKVQNYSVACLLSLNRYEKKSLKELVILIKVYLM